MRGAFARAVDGIVCWGVGEGLEEYKSTEEGEWGGGILDQQIACSNGGITTRGEPRRHVSGETRENKNGKEKDREITAGDSWIRAKCSQRPSEGYIASWSRRGPQGPSAFYIFVSR